MKYIPKSYYKIKEPERSGKKKVKQSKIVKAKQREIEASYR